jgi:threonine/homoserine/homoserine lactone efflux protein
MTATSVLLFAAPFTVAALVPGPAQTALVARVVARGGRGVATFVAGMVFGNAVWLALAAFGLGALAARLHPVFVAIKWAGVAYLVLLAVRLWRAPAVAASADAPREGKLPGFATGTLLTLGNPKALVFFTAVLPSVLAVGSLSLRDYVEVAAVGLAIDVAVQCVYVATAARARRLLQSPSRMRTANRSAAVVLLGSAAAIAARE